eukprot:TRINITY_DN5287_c0_g2_i5.p1 TRINITY_DN5287_c0_g2~~TRINITY_DN5287_c0_g2_i5.p1  ORF type:complete len:153 (-),score=16.77 TRINITY_DN5287_c0_g2_i5:446-904(-)
MASAVYTPKRGLYIGPLRAADYPFPCYWCSECQKQGTIARGVRIHGQSDQSDWARMCGPCYEQWVDAGEPLNNPQRVDAKNPDSESDFDAACVVALDDIEDQTMHEALGITVLDDSFDNPRRLDAKNADSESDFDAACVAALDDIEGVGPVS